MKITFLKKNFSAQRATKCVAIPLFIFQGFFCVAESVKNIRFNHFSANLGISQPVFTSIMQDKKGYMWFGTITGLIKYDGYTITAFNADPSIKNSLPDDGISKLCEDVNGNIWIASVNYPRLTKYNPSTGKFTVYNGDKEKNQLGLTGYVYSLVNDKQGRLWVGTKSGNIIAVILYQPCKGAKPHIPFPVLYY